MRKKIFFILILAGIFIFVPAAVYAQDSLTVRVGLTRSFANRESISVGNTAIFAGRAVDGGFMPVQELNSAGGFSVRANGGRVEILSGGSVAYAFNAGVPAVIMAADGEFVRLGSYSFRGVMEFVPVGARITAVNVLSIEEYLFGVLPSEMAPHFHPEALKAQAVAARTYTFRRIRQAESHRNDPFDMCDTTCCQVYRGATRESEATTNAVLETYGLMLFFRGQPIIAQYFSSSGGATENSEDVWVEARPYARSVNEVAEHNPMVWERSFTWAQLTSAASSRGAGIGTVNGVSISNLGASGRVLELTLHGTGGDWVVPRNVGIRGFFTPIGGTLPSRNFQVVGGAHTTPYVMITDGVQSSRDRLNSFQAVDRNGVSSTVHHAYIFDGTATRRIDSTPTIVRGGSGITLLGRGWGHGVGMSQMGAEGMARAGYSFMDILRHYYTGVQIHAYGGYDAETLIEF